ncbi:hypothetical protein [Streptomyces sp. NPDC001194]|uniref:hypothetical protein n=1 Tax=Streptomyces sp. NPDC001194 TaxID=3364547 RepID=UPI0036D18DF5
MITCACGAPPVVQWQRRARPDEGGPDDTVPVYACADHALDPDASTLLHQASCTAGETGPVCTCTPEPIGDPMAARA